ncbi:uncharacterized protein RAG0_02471 [Rhynchosporium agropyri]|uniref:Uncharacterized protein n=1 Tax=Rhynchosporium agropyri TaxID=914238 RepID=A0A1E1K1B3_9HELO|nr:uncharacterized protein RAG0_02471 [Rhynchosporium agropyri]
MKVDKQGFRWVTVEVDQVADWWSPDHWGSNSSSAKRDIAPAMKDRRRYVGKE